MRAQLLISLSTVSFFCASGRAFSDPWSTQPLIGVVGQYASNPALLANPQSETNAAFVLSLPVNYDLDSFHFAATPSARYGNATGYSSVTSNYFHFDTRAVLAGDLDTTSISGAYYRDSSLLFAGEIDNGVGVRRDTSTADILWQRSLNELDLLQLDLASYRTQYAQSDTRTEINNLIDYRYTTFTPALVFALSERNNFRVIGGVSRYEAINGATSSNTVNVQLGFDRQLSELWTLKTTAGYSKSTDREKFTFIGFAPITLDTTQNSTVYSATLSRQSERLTLSVGASRALAPTGYSYLSRQQSVNLAANYVRSERWSFNGSINWQTNTNPLTAGGTSEIRYYYGSISANWHWTEQWVVTLQAIKVAERYGEPTLSVTSNGLNLQISRQFFRTDL